MTSSFPVPKTWRKTYQRYFISGDISRAAGNVLDRFVKLDDHSCFYVIPGNLQRATDLRIPRYFILEDINRAVENVLDRSAKSDIYVLVLKIIQLEDSLHTTPKYHIQIETD